VDYPSITAKKITGKTGFSSISCPWIIRRRQKHPTIDIDVIFCLGIVGAMKMGVFDYCLKKRKKKERKRKKKRKKKKEKKRKEKKKKKKRKKKRKKKKKDEERRRKSTKILCEVA